MLGFYENWPTPCILLRVMDANALIQFLSGQPASAGISGLLQGSNAQGGNVQGAQGTQGESQASAFQAVLAALGITPEDGAALALANAANGSAQSAADIGQPLLGIGQLTLDNITVIQNLLLAGGGGASLDGLVQAGLISAEDAAAIADGGALSDEIIAQIPGLATALNALAAAAGNTEGSTETDSITTPGEGAQNASSTAGDLPGGNVPTTAPTDGQVLPAGLALAAPQATLNSKAAKTEAQPEALLDDIAGATAAAAAIAQQAGQSTAPVLPGAASLRASAVVEAVFSGNPPSKALADLQLALGDAPLAGASNSQGQGQSSQGAQGAQGAVPAGQPTAQTAVDDLMAQFQAPAQAAGGVANAAAKANSFIPGQMAEAAVQTLEGTQQSGADIQTLAGRSGDAQPITLASLGIQKTAAAHADPAISTASAGKAAEQVAVSISKAVKLGDTTFTVRLDPPQLGRVDVRMEILSDGRVHATLSAERWDTVESLQRESRILERAFQDAGLKPDSMNFNLKDDQRRGPLPFDGQDDQSGLPGDEEDLEDILPSTATPQGVISSGALDIRV